MKIKNLKEVAEYHRDLLYGKTMGVQQKDIPKKGPAVYGSLENQESTNDVNWVTDPSTGLEYRITE
jgi:hypothetical protein